MLRFAFLAHPLYVEQVYQYVPSLKDKEKGFVTGIIQWLPPFKLLEMVVESTNNVRIKGIIVIVPLLPNQILDIKRHIVLKKIISAGQLAERLGAQILGLGAFTAVVGKNGEYIARSLKIPVTTGNSYTVASTVHLIKTYENRTNKAFSESILTIIGATGSIGRGISILLGRLFQKIILVARNEAKLHALLDELSQYEISHAEIGRDMDKIIPLSDVIVCATSSPDILIDIEKVKKGAMLIDISRPSNIIHFKDLPKRGDITFIEGGMVYSPSKWIDKTKQGMPCENIEGITSSKIFSCLAETMILSFENRMENYSIGRNLCIEKIGWISKKAEEHGFQACQA